MTPEHSPWAADGRPRFPLVLTLAAAAAFAIMTGLGAWQLQRAAWKDRELARITALQHAAPVPIAPVLAGLARGDTVDFTRVTATCSPRPAEPAALHPVTDNGDWVSRALTLCAIDAPPFDSILIDRGFVTASRGQSNPASVTLPAPAQVTGVLLSRTTSVALAVDESDPHALTKPAPVVLIAESESPPAPGVVPTPYPGSAADQLQYVGAYAPTWFGLAGALCAIYAAVLWRRYHPKR